MFLLANYVKLCEIHFFFGILKIHANKEYRREEREHENKQRENTMRKERKSVMKQVKQYRILDEGYLKLTLSAGKDFDPYMLKMMHSCIHALPCQRKTAAKTVFYYDLYDCISFKNMCALCEFNQKEAYAYLFRLFTQLNKIYGDLPIYAKTDTIYYDPATCVFSFVILPIHDHVYEMDWGELLREMMAELSIAADSLYGCLYRITQMKALTPDVILEQLVLWKKRQMWQERWRRWWNNMQRAKQRQKENERRLHAELQAVRFVRRSQEWNHMPDQNNEEGICACKQRSDTIALFATNTRSCLKDDMGHVHLLKEEMLVGRQESCDIVLPYQTVSAQHARIKMQDAGVIVMDLESENGTSVNGKKIKAYKEVFLHDQDVIAFADCRWKYEEGHK